jgi:hypothetical protein
VSWGLTASLRVARVDDRVLGAFFMMTGAFLVYLVMFSQSDLLAALVGAGAAHQNYLHEFFHDGRHLFNAPCH